MLCNGEPVNKYLKIVELSNGTADGVIASFDQALFKLLLELLCTCCGLILLLVENFCKPGI